MKRILISPKHSRAMRGSNFPDKLKPEVIYALALSNRPLAKSRAASIGTVAVLATLFAGGSLGASGRNEKRRTK